MTTALRTAATAPAAALACAALMTLAMLTSIGLLADTEAAAPQWAQATIVGTARG